MGFSTFDERTAQNWQIVFNDTSYPTPSPFAPPDVRASRFDTIIGTNNDTVDHTLGAYFDFGAGPVHFATVTLPAGAGEPGTPSVDVLDALIPATSPGIVLAAGSELGFAQYEALGSGKLIRIVAIGGYC